MSLPEDLLKRAHSLLNENHEVTEARKVELDKEAKVFLSDVQSDKIRSLKFGVNMAKLADSQNNVNDVVKTRKPRRVKATAIGRLIKKGLLSFQNLHISDNNLPNIVLEADLTVTSKGINFLHDEGLLTVETE